MEGPVVLITGANNGIGFHMARSLLEDGCRLAAFDLQIDHIAAWEGEFPGRFLALVCDVTDRERVKASVGRVVEHFGRIDILVNNADLLLYHPFGDTPVEEGRREMEVNFWGYVNMIEAVLPVMKEQGGGIIHNVGSAIGITGFAGAYGYTSSKGAIEALTRTLRLDYAGTGIRFCLMHPPLTDTASAAPLAMPKYYMDDPRAVGRRLARKVRSTANFIPSDIKAWAFQWFGHLLPGLMGRIFSSQSGKYRKK